MRRGHEDREEPTAEREPALHTRRAPRNWPCAQEVLASVLDRVGEELVAVVPVEDPPLEGEP